MSQPVRCPGCAASVVFAAGYCPQCGWGGISIAAGPVRSGAPPKVLIWFRLLALLSILGSFALIVTDLIGGQQAALFDDGGTNDSERLPRLFVWSLCVVSTAVGIFGLILPRRPWVWVFGIVFLVLATLQCCIPPLIILIFWLKPNCRSWFNGPTLNTKALGKVFE